MPTKRPLSDEENLSSDRAEKISPNNNNKRKLDSKKPRLHPKDADAVSYISDSDRDQANKAKSSVKRLSFGFADAEEPLSDAKGESSEKRTRKPSEKVLYMAENNLVESDTPATPAKKRSPTKKSTSKTANADGSEAWSDWSASDLDKLAKNDRNAAPSTPTPRSQKSEHVRRRRADHDSSPDIRESDSKRTSSPKKPGKDGETRLNRYSDNERHGSKRRGRDDNSDFENLTPRTDNKQRSREDIGSSKKQGKHGFKADLSPSQHSDAEHSTPKRRRRDTKETTVSDEDDLTPTNAERRKSSAKGSSHYRENTTDEILSSRKQGSASKDKGKQRAYSPSATSSTETGTRFPQERQPLSERQAVLEGKGIKNVHYPEMSSACTSFTGFKHLPHTFSLDGRPSNLLSCERFHNSMHEKDKKSFLSALDFTRDGPFINPSRSRLNNLSVGKYGRLVFGRDENALFLFNGAVGYCSLVEPVPLNGPNVRCISVYPFKDDFIQWKKFFASVIQKTDFITYTDNDVLSFLSRKEHAVDETSTSKTYSSPKKASKLFDPDSDAGGESGGFHSARIPNSLAYTDRVPIYDARGSTFLLSDKVKDFSNLPLYKSGLQDLPQFAIVTVGHTASTFSYNAERNLTALQLHVIFVLLHGFIVEED